MTANYFLKHEIPFQFDPDIGMFEQVNLIKLKYADQRFGLGYKPNKDYYMRVFEIKTEARMTRIKGNELEKEELTILPF